MSPDDVLRYHAQLLGGDVEMPAETQAEPAAGPPPGVTVVAALGEKHWGG